jgi:hypothetical protein
MGSQTPQTKIHARHPAINVRLLHYQVWSYSYERKAPGEQNKQGDFSEQQPMCGVVRTRGVGSQEHNQWIIVIELKSWFSPENCGGDNVGNEKRSKCYKFPSNNTFIIPGNFFI